MEQPLISVLIPVYGVEPVLPRCLDSVLKQTYTNLQIVVVDDTSPDESPRICDEYAMTDPRITVVHHPQNRGLATARNTGLSAAEGKYISFIDSDDYVAPDFIEFLFSLLTEHGADIASCGVLTVTEHGKKDTGNVFDQLLILDPKDAVERMCYNDLFYVTAWDKLYRRELFDGLRFPDGLLFEDTALIPIVAARAKVLAAKGDPKYFYLYSPDSITNSRFTRKKLDYVTASDRMAAFVVSNWSDLKPAAERKQLLACFSTLCQLVNSDLRDREVEQMLLNRLRPLKRSVLHDPRASKRDKAAILSLSLGYPFFRFAWRCYRKVKK